MLCRDSRSGGHKGSEWILQRSHNMTDTLINVEDRPGIEPCLYVKKLSERAVLPVRECGSAAGYNMTTSSPSSPAETSQNKLLVITSVEHCINNNMNVGKNPGVRTLVDSKETAIPRILRRLQWIELIRGYRVTVSQWRWVIALGSLLRALFLCSFVFFKVVIH